MLVAKRTRPRAGVVATRQLGPTVIAPVVGPVCPIVGPLMGLWHQRRSVDGPVRGRAARRLVRVCVMGLAGIRPGGPGVRDRGQAHERNWVEPRCPIEAVA